MTKLTQEQVEKERAAFEEWFFNYYDLKISKLYDKRQNAYESIFPNDSWSAWLARAELANKEGE